MASRKQIRKEEKYLQVKNFVRAAIQVEGCNKAMLNCAYNDLKKELKKETSAVAAEVALKAVYAATVASLHAKKAIVRHSTLWNDAPEWTPDKRWTSSTFARAD